MAKTKKADGTEITDDVLIGIIDVLDKADCPKPDYIVCGNCGVVVLAEKYADHISQCNAERKL